MNRIRKNKHSKEEESQPENYERECLRMYTVLMKSVTFLCTPISTFSFESISLIMQDYVLFYYFPHCSFLL